MSEHRTLYKMLAVPVIAYCLIVVASYFIGGNSFRYEGKNTGEIVNATAHVGEIVPGELIEQPFRIDADMIAGVKLIFGTYSRENIGTMSMSIRNERGETICERIFPVNQLPNTEEMLLYFIPAPHVTPGEALTLVLKTDDLSEGNSVTVFYGSTISITRGEVDRKLDEADKARLNGETLDGVLCYQVIGQKELLFGRYYWYLAAAGLAALLIAESAVYKKYREGKRSRVISLIRNFRRYRFLLKQLINRDFKSRYKRSVLGMLWSVLNPVITMLVQFFVFSALFKSGISNFALYLLIGSVCFSFFSEATSLALTSIIGNAALINKVFVPKIIYPFTRVISSAINFLLSFIPLLLVMLITGAKISWAMLFLPIGIVFLVGFCFGVGMLLACSMVFFRDTQFLWGIASMLWMYLTPIFYPVSIIPEKYLTLYKCNPMYQFIHFFRTILMNGTSPSPRNFAVCFLSAAIFIVLANVVLEKTQDKFTLYL